MNVRHLLGNCLLDSLLNRGGVCSGNCLDLTALADRGCCVASANTRHSLCLHKSRVLHCGHSLENVGTRLDHSDRLALDYRGGDSLHDRLTVHSGSDNLKHKSTSEQALSYTRIAGNAILVRIVGLTLLWTVVTSLV